MKTRVILIIGLLILCFIAPALADQEVTLGSTYSDDRALTVKLEKVVETDTSDIYSPFNFPPDKYKFITLYYSLYNPSDRDVTYEFNVSIRDQANRIFNTDEFILGEKVAAGGKLLNRHKDFAVYRNSTTIQLLWTDKQPNPPWFHYDTVIDIVFPSPTPIPTTSPITPTPTSTPTPTPTRTSPVGQCLPFLPIGILLAGVGSAGLLTRKYGPGR
jgi:hypothetical protein